MLVFPILMSFSVIFLYGNNCVGGTKYESIVSYQQQRKQQKQKEQQRKKQKEQQQKNQQQQRNVSGICSLLALQR